MQSNGAVRVFGVLNLVWAGVCACFAMLVLLGLVYGIFFSGDPPREIFEGVVGSLIMLVPALVAGAVYLFAGIWLLTRRVQGYYLHLVGAGLALFSCLGLLYAVPAFIVAFQPGFRDAFLPSASPPLHPCEPPLPALDV